MRSLCILLGASQMPSLVKIDPAALVTFIDDLRIGPRDDVKLRIRGGIASAHVKRASGRVQSVTTMLNGRLRRLTDFRSSGLSPTERRKVVKELRKEGHRQTAIADLIGFSQTTVSHDLKKLGVK